MRQSRLVLVDDQVLFVESLRDVLHYRVPEIEVVAIGYDGRQAVQLAKQHKPDIMLLDVRMPELSGVEAVSIIKANEPSTRVVMLTTYDDDEYVSQAIRNGAIGYLLKDVPIADLVDSLRAINSGSFVLPANIAQKLWAPSTGTVYHGGFHENTVPAWYYQLSHKERRMLRLLAERYSNYEIATEVNLAEQTVKNYLSSIYEKIGVGNRREAAEVGERYKHFL